MSSSQGRLYVLAGTYVEFTRFVREAGPSLDRMPVYLAQGRPDLLRGTRHPIVVRVGRWHARPDAKEWEREFLLRQAIVDDAATV